MSEFTARLSGALTDLMRGNIEDLFRWADVVCELEQLLLPMEEKIEEPFMNGGNIELPMMEPNVPERSVAILTAPTEVQFDD
jgi:branched-chain amino acid aminotransferase